MPFHAQPPPTPWLPTARFADESLLLNAQPIFEDVSLGSEFEWGDTTGSPRKDDTPLVTTSINGTTLNQTEVRENMDQTLDLGDYLPEEVDVTKIEDTTRNDMSEGSTTDNTRSERSSSTISLSIHKREGSLSLLSESGQAKKVKPSTPVRDDLYKRRLSDSNRRSSSASLSPMLPSLPLPPSSSASCSSYPSSLSSSTSSRPAALNTASSRLKDAIRRTKEEAEGQEVQGLAVNGAFRKHVAPHRLGAIQSSSKTTSLSQYLTESSNIVSDRDMAVNETTDPSLPSVTPRSSKTGEEVTTQTLQKHDETSYLDGVHIGLITSTPQPKSPLSAGSSSSSNTEESGNATMSSRTPHEATSRRESMSGKVVSFFSGLLRLSPSTESLKQAGCEEVRDGLSQDVVEVDEETAHDSAENVPVETHRIARAGPCRRPIVAPLTKPIPFSRPLHIRAKPQPAIANPGKAPGASTNIQPSTANRQPLQSSQRQNVNVPSVKHQEIQSKLLRPRTTSAFASAALARLPPPGKGSTAAAQPVRIRETERAKDLASRRGVFEQLTGGSTGTASTASSSSSSQNLMNVKSSSVSVQRSDLQRTIPVRGQTPGKASEQRAAQRAKFDEAMKQKMEEKERMLREQMRERKEQEEEEIKRIRKETVIWAKPVPAMYHRQS